jgi:RHS repeat-associated protein
MMAAMPEHMQKEMEKGMKHMLEKGPTPLGRTIMSNMGIDPDSFIGGIREGIKQIEQEEQTPVEIHFYHCDHLGTPIALTDRNGKIVWAARYDPWGNIEEEFNPHNIEQNIRLPGQHHDRETGLYYNRHRYYDPKIGSYINQDPIGLRGGNNFYHYPTNPLGWADPLGLQSTSHAGREWGSQTACKMGCHYGDPSNVTPYNEREGAVSVSVGINANGGVGGSTSVGVTVGKNKGDYLPNACVFIQSCEAVGAGIAGGCSVEATVHNSGPTSGPAYAVGGYTAGGGGGKAGGSVMVNKDDPAQMSASGNLGLGGGASVGGQACQNYSKCIKN